MLIDGSHRSASHWLAAASLAILGLVACATPKLELHGGPQPDEWAVEVALSQGSYDIVIVNLVKQDRATVGLLDQVRQRFTTGVVVALLPETARGAGVQVKDLGCSDYIYAPITRRGLMAVIGKYLGFEPVDQ